MNGDGEVVMAATEAKAARVVHTVAARKAGLTAAVALAEVVRAVTMVLVKAATMVGRRAAAWALETEAPVATGTVAR